MTVANTRQSQKRPPRWPMLFFFLFIAICSCRNRNYLTRHYSDALFDSARSLEISGLATRAEQFIDSAYSSFPEISIQDKYRYYVFKNDVFGDHYSKLKNNDSCILYSDSMLLLIEKNHLTKKLNREYANAYSYKGMAYADQKRYEEAFKNFSISKFIAADIPDSCLIGSYDAQLALVLYYQSKFREAASLFIQSLSETGGCMNNADKFYKVQGWINSIGLCYQKAGMPDSALYYFNKDYVYINENKSIYSYDPKFPEIALAVVCGNEGRIWEEKRNYKKAEELYIKSITINRRKGYDNQDAVATQLYLAEIYLETARNDSAFSILDKVKGQIIVHEESIRLHWLNLMWKYQVARGDVSGANRYRIRYLEYKDSLGEKNKYVLQTNADAAYQHLSNKYSLDLLQKKNKLKTIYLMVFIAFGVLAIIVILLIWRNWRRSRMYITKLTSINNLIARQNDHVVKTLQALEQSQEENNRMMRIVAHDLRGPIGGIINFTELLKDRMIDPKRRNGTLSLMQQAAKGALTLIGDLLNTNLSGNDLVKEPVNLQDLLQYCINLLEHSAMKKKQQIFFQPESAFTEGDPEKLWRVFTNLIANAIKFSQESATINLQMQLRGDSVIVMVKDRGIGIPDYLKDKIFDIVPEAKRKGTTGEGSFGLGLAISRQIVELHGGKLWFESESDLGSTFFVKLSLSA